MRAALISSEFMWSGLGAVQWLLMHKINYTIFLHFFLENHEEDPYSTTTQSKVLIFNLLPCSFLVDPSVISSTFSHPPSPAMFPSVKQIN